MLDHHPPDPDFLSAPECKTGFAFSLNQREAKEQAFILEILLEYLYDPLVEKIFSLVTNLMSFAISFVCFFNWAETSFSGKISLWHSL
jgi:hypothetical protein